MNGLVVCEGQLMLKSEVRDNTTPGELQRSRTNETFPLE